MPHLALHVVRALLQAGPALEPGKLLPVLGHYATGGSEGQAGGTVAASSGQLEVLCQNENIFFKLKMSFNFHQFFRAIYIEQTHFFSCITLVLMSLMYKTKLEM